MNEAMALRLDERTLARLGRIARRHGTSRSALVRQAIVALVEKEEGRASASPYDLVEAVLGSVDGGDPLRSEGGGRRVAEVLKRAWDGR